MRELPDDVRNRRINATVVPAEALAPQPVALTAEFPASDHTSIFHTGAGDAPQVVVAFNRPVADFDETSPSLSVTGATAASVSPHRVAGEAANAYVVTLTPAGAGDITFGLVADETCADGGNWVRQRPPTHQRGSHEKTLLDPESEALPGAGRGLAAGRGSGVGGPGSADDH